MAKRDENGKFLPGESGNPNGRPKKGQSLTEVLASKVDKEQIAQLLMRLAEEGNFAALRYIYDRVDGMPRQTAELTGRDGAPIAIQYVNDFDGI